MFLKNAEEDSRIGPTHISLFVSLFYRFLNMGEKNPISFKSSDIMRAAKICSRATYNKCMKGLHDFGYLEYLPCHSPSGESTVFFNTI